MALHLGVNAFTISYACDGITLTTLNYCITGDCMYTPMDPFTYKILYL